MKITPPIEHIAAGIESWAQTAGWKAVGVRFADEYQRQGGGNLIPPADSELGIRNAIQRVKRIFGLGGPRYKKMASNLAGIALDAMPKQRRMELEEPDSPALATARAMTAYGEAMAALAIRCPSATMKLHQLIGDLQALVPVAEVLMSV